MFFRAAFNALALFTAFSSAAPAYKADNFDITHLKTHQPPTNASNSQNMTLSFIVYDPNPITNSSALCSGSWPVNGTYPTGGYVRRRIRTFIVSLILTSYRLHAPTPTSAGTLRTEASPASLNSPSRLSTAMRTMRKLPPGLDLNPRQHTYASYSVGQYPYNEITNFAKASITSGNVTCTAQQNATLAGGLDCSQRRNGTLFAPITATIAKKR